VADRALVTGAGGFIGSHLVEELVRRGDTVRALVHYNARNNWGNLEHLPPAILEEVEIIAGDVGDPFGVARAVEDRDVVYHLAALIGIPYSYVSPQSYVTTNVVGTLNVLEAVRAQPGTRMVHTSTSETYGTARYTPIDEEHPMQGQSPYSATKIGADKLVESYYKSFETPVATLRPFNTFGPRQSLRAVIPTIISQALSGDVIRLGSLSPVRDFTFVKDTARAFIAVGTTEAAAGLTLNAGNGKAITVGDLVDLILDIVGTEATVETEDQRVRPDASEVFELLADATKINQVTGWAPEVSLRAGLEETVGFVRANLGLFKSHLYTV
jgi:NAD dependent epimerase/dehydratase